ncbi:MAG: SpoIVB peptidase [Clostridia bacterium]|nr:SpoIVB peptidase [Clostridia bacterium]
MKKFSFVMLFVCAFVFAAMAGGFIGKSDSIFTGDNQYDNIVSCNTYADNIAADNICGSCDASETISLSDIFGFGRKKVVSTGRYVYLGGFPIGISVKTDGVIITAKVGVVTKEGVVYPLSDIDIAAGDVLQSISGNPVYSAADVAKVLSSMDGSVTLKVRRGDTINEYTVTPAIDSVNGEKKLGMLLQEAVNGIGTMTFVDGDRHRYGALGHPIKDAGGNNIAVSGGEIYNAVIKGSVKGEVGKAGELNGAFSRDDGGIGSIDTNNMFGIYGSYSASLDGQQRIEVASRQEITPGKAQIYSTVVGTQPQVYDIEIIKVNNQDSPEDRSMVIRVTDPKLLSLTGGIVQGMSGSPIVQNGKLVGAVTHVLINDPTKGYALFAEWMLDR